MNRDTFNVKKILKDFGAKTEDELLEIVNDTWHVSECTKCGKELDLRTCQYIDGDPVCYGGCHGQR